MTYKEKILRIEQAEESARIKIGACITSEEQAYKDFFEEVHSINDP